MNLLMMFVFGGGGGSWQVVAAQLRSREQAGRLSLAGAQGKAREITVQFSPYSDRVDFCKLVQSKIITMLVALKNQQRNRMSQMV